MNRARLDADAAGRIELRPGDWYRALEPGIAGKVDLVVANPPYIAASEWRDLDPVVRDFDPREALVAGETGREAIEVILEGAPAWLSRDGAAVVELAPHQVAAAVAFAGACGAVGTQVRRDLSGRDRVLGRAMVTAERKPVSVGDVARALERGENVGVPTDTVYGLAATLSNPVAVDRLFALKGRPKDLAIPVLVADLLQAEDVAGGSDPRLTVLADSFWPGALTIVVRRRGD